MSLSNPGSRARAKRGPHDYATQSSSTNLASGNVKSHLPCVFVPDNKKIYLMAPQEEFGEGTYLLKPGTEGLMGLKLQKFQRKMRWRRFLHEATTKQIVIFGWVPLGVTLIALGALANESAFFDALLYLSSYPLFGAIIFLAFLPKIQKKRDFGVSKLRQRFHEQLMKSGALAGVRKFRRKRSGIPYAIGTPSHESLYEALREYHEIDELVLTSEELHDTLEDLSSKFPSERLALEIESVDRQYDELIQKIEEKEQVIAGLLKSKG